MPDMIDGPHRTLPLSDAWRRAAKCIENDNYSLEQVQDAIRGALVKDWRADVGDFARRVLKILSEQQPDLGFAAQIEYLRREAAGYPLRGELLMLAERHLDSPWVEESWIDDIRGLLRNTMLRHARRIREHYLLKAPECAGKMRTRLSWGCDVHLDELAAELATGGSGRLTRQVKAKDLESGVPLP